MASLREQLDAATDLVKMAGAAANQVNSAISIRRSQIKVANLELAQRKEEVEEAKRAMHIAAEVVKQHEMALQREIALLLERTQEVQRLKAEQRRLAGLEHAEYIKAHPDTREPGMLGDPEMDRDR